MVGGRRCDLSYDECELVGLYVCLNEIGTSFGHSHISVYISILLALFALF